ncbi:hypothetical protein, partial [Roseovarius sp. SYSU LYC5161]|uniref:hypothetical protein n=1 Tax=Roseovarius halophilus (ex Wu et al. 2025) TaxID=3376060 RepID=UPI00399A5649
TPNKFSLMGFASGQDGGFKMGRRDLLFGIPSPPRRELRANLSLGQRAGGSFEGRRKRDKS